MKLANAAKNFGLPFLQSELNTPAWVLRIWMVFPCSSRKVSLVVFVMDEILQIGNITHLFVPCRKVELRTRLISVLALGGV